MASGVERSRSVSSTRSRNSPPSCLAKSQLKMAARMLPICTLPVGEGAKRTRTVMVTPCVCLVFRPARAPSRPPPDGARVASTYYTPAQRHLKAGTRSECSAALERGSDRCSPPCQARRADLSVPGEARPRAPRPGGAPQGTAPRRWPGTRAAMAVEDPLRGSWEPPRRFPRTLPGAMVSRPRWGHWGQPSGYGLFLAGMRPLGSRECQVGARVGPAQSPAPPSGDALRANAVPRWQGERVLPESGDVDQDSAVFVAFVAAEGMPFHRASADPCARAEAPGLAGMDAPEFTGYSPGGTSRCSEREQQPADSRTAATGARSHFMVGISVQEGTQSPTGEGAGGCERGHVRYIGASSPPTQVDLPCVSEPSP